MRAGILTDKQFRNSEKLIQINTLKKWYYYYGQVHFENATRWRFNMKEQCLLCGVTVEVDGDYNKRVFCGKCQREFWRKRREMKEEYDRLRIEVMIENAITILEQGGTYIMDCLDEIEEISNNFRNNPKLYKSAPEIVSAIVLKSNGVLFAKEYKVGRYCVDFYIPMLNVVLEIDGERHKHKVNYDGARDSYIRRQLGSEFEVIRIPVETLKLAPHKLVEAIQIAYTERSKQRKQHKDTLTYKYSRTEQAYYDGNVPIEEKRIIKQ